MSRARAVSTLWRMARSSIVHHGGEPAKAGGLSATSAFISFASSHRADGERRELPPFVHCPHHTPLYPPSALSGLQARQYSEELRVLHPELVAEPMYHQLADRTLDYLQEKLEAFVEDNDVEGSDVEYGQGVLTVCLGQHGTYVINKQTPNRQVWLSSPVSGPLRYDCVAPGGDEAAAEGIALRCPLQGRWVYHRDGRELMTQLDKEMLQLIGASPKLSSEQ